MHRKEPEEWRAGWGGDISATLTRHPLPHYGSKSSNPGPLLPSTPQDLDLSTIAIAIAISNSCRSCLLHLSPSYSSVNLQALTALCCSASLTEAPSASTPLNAQSSVQHEYKKTWPIITARIPMRYQRK